MKFLIFLGLSKGTQGPSRHIIKNQYQGLEFEGEVFFTNSLLPQSMTILHSALQKDSILGRKNNYGNKFKKFKIKIILNNTIRIKILNNLRKNI